MNANMPEEKPQNHALDSATQEKIREFCYELALALRRITGKVVEDFPEGSSSDMDKNRSEFPKRDDK